MAWTSSTAAALSAGTGERWDALGRLLGRLHPTVVHFPIALLIVATGVEAAWALRKRAGPSPTALVCVGVAAAGAAAAAGMGWLNAAFEEVGNDSWVLSWHRWIGITVAALSALLMVAAWHATRGGSALRVYRAGLVLAAVLVSVGGHLGGMLTYGDSYITDAARALWQAPAPHAPAVSPPAPHIEPAPVGEAGTIDFDSRVRPILAQNCYSCHGRKKRRGGLRLDLADEAAKGGKFGPVIIPGDPDGSELVKRITADDPDVRMPLDGDPLPPDQTQTLRDWIAQGAHWPADPG